MNPFNSCSLLLMKSRLGHHACHVDGLALIVPLNAPTKPVMVDLSTNEKGRATNMVANLCDF